MTPEVIHVVTLQNKKRQKDTYPVYCDLIRLTFNTQDSQSPQGRHDILRSKRCV